LEAAQQMTQSAREASVLRIGSRGSPLALIQARAVQSRLAAAAGLDSGRIEIVAIRTTGDVVQDRPLAEAGGKGLFTKEIEEALIAGKIDLAVHSSKDLPTFLPAGRPHQPQSQDLARARGRRCRRHRFAAA
jgi:hydroxymethylbilane synthase